jgi:hypothetical protein
MVDRVYQVDGTLTALQVAQYDVLAAGALTDVLGDAVDLDELKGFTLTCVTGSIKIVAPAANFLAVFAAAADALHLSVGQTLAFDFAAGGLAIGTSSKFNVVDTAGGVGSTYSLMFVGSN